MEEVHEHTLDIITTIFDIWMISEGQLTYISMVIEIRDEGVYINQQEYIRNIDIPLLDSN